MAMDRIQFQHGLYVHQFMKLYGTQDKCETTYQLALPDPGGFEHLLEEV